MFDLSFISVICFFLESPRQGYAVRTDGGIVAQRRPPIPIGSRKPEPPGAGGYNWHKQSKQIRNDSRGPSSMSIVVEEALLCLLKPLSPVHTLDWRPSGP